MITSNTINKIAAALVKVQSEMGNATKDSKNPFFKSNYADLNAIREVSLPALNKHGITALQPTVLVDGKKYVQTTLLHESGEYIAGLTEILLAKENNAQDQGSGISYARRYGLQSLLNIGAEDDDGEKAIGRNNKNAASTASVPPAAGVAASNGAAKPAASTSFRRPVSNGAAPVANGAAAKSEEF